MMLMIGRQSTSALRSIASCSSSSSSSSIQREIVNVGQHRSLSTSSILLRNTPARRPKDPLENASNAKRHPLSSGETFIVRPPPSVASYRYAPSSNGNVSPENLPLLKRSSRSNGKNQHHEKHKSLNQDEISEIQRLRTSDPIKYSPLQLARQFGCSPTFVRIIAPATESRVIAHQREFEAKKASWGENKTLQRELRRVRRTLW